MPVLAQSLSALRPATEDLLTRSLRFPSVSGQEADFTRFIAHWADSHGFETDLFETDERHLPQHPALAAKHIPLAGRPTLVVKLSATAPGPSVIFNAHADVVPAPHPERWTHPPFAAFTAARRVYGRGAADVKGPLAAALIAMLAVKESRIPHGDILLELVPGEEDCVGLGTLTSFARGYTHTDASIILEPTENLPRCASRAGLRFEITCTGRSVHGTVKWLGVDAISLLHQTYAALQTLESRWTDPSADRLFGSFPHTRPVTVDRVTGGDYQGMVADHATLAGYFELLPTDDIPAWKTRFEAELRAQLARQSVAPATINSHIQVRFTEEYAGHRTPPDHPMYQLAAQVHASLPPENPADDPNLALPAAFNSGCEAGLRQSLTPTPTIVWGPGSLAQAHAVDEYIEWAAVHRAARLFATFLAHWTTTAAASTTSIAAAATSEISA